LAEGHLIEAKAAFERALQLAVEQNHQGPKEELEDQLSQLKIEN